VETVILAISELTIYNITMDRVKVRNIVAASILSNYNVLVQGMYTLEHFHRILINNHID